MDLHTSYDLVPKPNLSCASDLMNEAFIESSDEDLYEDHKSLSIGPDSLVVSHSNTPKCYKTGKDSQKKSTEETSDVFEQISMRKSSYPCNFKVSSHVPWDNSRHLSETDKLSVSRRSSEIGTLFSPLDDISNLKLEQSANKEALGSFIGKNFFTTASKLGDIRIPEFSKENFCEIPNFTKSKSKLAHDLHFKENKKTKQPFEELKSVNCLKQRPAVQPRKQIPVLNRNTGNKLPNLKSEASNLRSKFQSPGLANEKLAIKAMSGFKFFTPNQGAKCSERRKSLQHENQLREARLLAEKKHRKSVSTLLRMPKDSNLKHEGKISKKKMPQRLDLFTFEKSNSAPTHPEKDGLVGKCADIMSASQNDKIDALAKEHGILEVTDLTLCANTVYFSRIFENTFEFPKKV